MRMVEKQVLICSASHDAVNSNAVLRNYVARGFAQLLGERNIRSTSLSGAEGALEAFSPALVLVFGSCMPDSCDYTRIRKLCDQKGIPLAFWLHDDPYEFDFNYKIFGYADILFTNDRWASLHISHPNVHYLPLAADIDAHFREIPKSFDRDYFFCGVGFSNRRQILQDSLPLLREKRGLICGAEWPAEPGFQNMRINNEQLPDFYSRSLATINLGRRFNLANQKYGLDAITPGPRTFEAAMAGAVQCFHFETTDILDSFMPEQEILLFDTPTELRDILDDLAADPELRYRIASNTQARCKSAHTYAHRAEKILSVLNGD